MKRSKVVLVFLFGSLICSAQSSRQVTTRHLVWVGVYGEYKFTPRLSSTLDIQGRYEYTDGDWVQWLVRAGVWYKTNHGTILGGGIARFNLYPNPNDKPARPEWRPWEEVGRKIKIGLHQTVYPRFRFEQRFIKEYSKNDLSHNYTFNSLRERFRIDYAYRFNPNTERGFSIIESQELLFTTKTSKFSALDAVRCSLGVGYEIDQFLTLQLTYLYQLQQKSSIQFEEHQIIRFTIQFVLQKPLKKNV